MYQHILLATDGSELSQKAAGHGLCLAKAIGARVTIVTVTGPPPGFTHPQIAAYMPDIMRKIEETAEDHLVAAQKMALSEGVACETLHVKGKFAHEGIVEAAKSRGCDLIIMGSHGWGAMKSFILGSVAQKVLAHSTVPVLVYR